MNRNRTPQAHPRPAQGARSGAAPAAAHAGGAHVRTADRAPRNAASPAATTPAHGAHAASAEHAAGAAARRPRSRYIPALDGLRTFAVAAVVLYHLGFSWIQGGLQGVTIFFVLSGYLITHLLLVEYRGTGKIDLKDFWIRRIRRLLPAIVTVIVATIVLCTLFNHVMLTKMRPDILPSLLFFNNWWQILRNVSYFDALGDPSPLTHFWSLAIEEQFYLLWPIILIVAFKLGARNKAVRRGTLALAVLSALAMTVLYDPAVDPSRVYYGTDTRVFSLLFGAWLAFIPEGSMRLGWLAARLRALTGRSHAGSAGASPEHAERAVGAKGPAHAERPAEALAPRKPFLIDIVGALSLAALVVIMVCTNGYTSFQYQGGTLLCTLLTLAVIAACVQPDSMLARVFSLPPLVWLGKRSYGIYLWHYPLLLLMNPVSDISAKPWWMYVIQIALVVLAAELSYRFIETPFRHGALGAALRRIRSERMTPARIARAYPVPLVAAMLTIVVAGGGLALVPETSALSAEGAALLEAGSDSGEPSDSDPAADAAGDATEPGDANAEDAESGTAVEGAYDIVMIGDSVSVRTIPVFQETFPHGYIDAAKNRQFGAGIEIFQSLVDQDLAGGILVFALGTNGPMTNEQIDTLMGIAGSNRTVVFVNTRSPQPWVSSTNATLASAAERYSNVRVIDWYGYSEGRNDLFDGDGTHLNETGAREYIGLVYSAVEDILPVHLDDPEQQQELQAKIQAATDGAATALREGISELISSDPETAGQSS